MDTRSTRRRLSRAASADGVDTKTVREDSVRAPEGKKTLEDRAVELKDKDFRMLLRAVVSQEGINVDIDRETAILRDNKASRGFFFRRFSTKGVTNDVWDWFLNHPEDADVAIGAASATTSTIGTEEAESSKLVSQRAKALESFAKAIKVKAGSLDPAKTYTSNFRRLARSLESKIKGHVKLLGTTMKLGYDYFRSCLSLPARDRVDKEFEMEIVPDADYDRILDRSIRYLCDELDDRKFRRNYDDEYRKLENKTYRFVDALGSRYVLLLSWFPGVKTDFEEQRLDFEKLLDKHRFSKDLQLAMLDRDFDNNFDKMVAFLREREKIIAKTNKVPFKPRPLETATVCQDYLMGRCKYGKRCNKKHEGKRICRLYLKTGTCRFGDKCRYQHVRKLPGAKPERQNLKTPLDIKSKEQNKKDKKDEEEEKKVEFELTTVSIKTVNTSGAKPYNVDPSLRQRQKAVVYFRGAQGIYKGRALVDTGAQPTTIHSTVLKKFSKLGVPFTFSKSKQYTRSFNGAVDAAIGEAVFTVCFRALESADTYIEAKLWAIVTDTGVTHDLLVGVDMQNLYSMAVHGNPNPQLRKLTVHGTAIESEPCSQSGQGYIVSELQAFARTIPSVLEVAKVEASDQCASAVIRDRLPTFRSLIEAPQQNVPNVKDSYQMIQESEAKKHMDSIHHIPTIPDQTTVQNADLTDNPIMVDLLDRIEKDVQSGTSMMSSREQFWYIRYILCRFQSVFVHKLSRCGGFKTQPYDILPWLKPGVKPLRQQPYKLPPDKLEQLKEAVLELCDAKVFYPVRNSDVKWASPGFPVWDKGKSKPRVVVAMQKLNNMCKLQYTVAPITEVTLMRVLNSPWNVYSDAKGGYRQIPTTVETQMVFIMILLFGAYASSSLPMGYKNSLQIFCERMEELCKDLKDTIAHVDDITNMGVNFYSGCLEFARYLLRCEAKNLKLAAKKLQVFPKRAKVLGLIKEAESYYPDPARYQALEELQSPIPGRKFKSSIRRIIGLFIYYLKFIPRFWDIAYPIKELLKDGAKAEWTPVHEQALSTLKTMLREASLSIPRFSDVSEDNPFIVDADASDVAGAGTLSQLIDGVEKLIACHSFAFSKVQIGWTIARKEMYTPLRLFDKWSMWLGGFPIKLRKDSRCAIWLVKHGQDKMREPWTRMSAAYDPWMIVKHEYRQRDLHVNPDTFTYESKQAKTTSKYEARRELKSLFPNQYQAAKDFLKDKNPEVKPGVHPVEAMAMDNTWGAPISEVQVWEVKEVAFETTSTEAEIQTQLLGDTKALLKAQMEEYGKHFRAIEDTSDKNHELVCSQYRIEDMLLYKFGSFEVGDAVPLLLCVPKQYRLEIMDAYHVDNLSNHRNATDLAARILKSYYWPKLAHDCRAYVKDCQVCIRAKTKLKKLPCAQNRYTSIMDSISLDAIGRVAGKRHHVLTCCILAIGYIIAKATKNLNSRKAAEFLLDIVTTYGVPKRIITDWGTEFVNKVFQHLKNRLRYRHVTISVKNSQGNSDLERKHRAYNEGVIAQLIQNTDVKGNWHLYLEMIVFSMNTLTNVRGYSPAMLLFGYQPELFPDKGAKRMKGSNAKDKKSIDDIDARLQRLQDIRLLFATFRDEQKFKANFKRNANLRSKYGDYAVGDQVWLYRKENRKDNPVTTKYDFKKTGPVVVVNVNRRSNTYRVVDESTGYSATVHAKFLSPHGRFRTLPEKDPVSSDEEDDSSASEVSSESEEEVSNPLVIEGKRSRRPAHHGPFISG